MRGIMHRRQSLPVTRPPFHILEVASANKLDPSQTTGIPQFPHIQILPAPDHRLHHHVLLPALTSRLHDLASFLHRGARRHRAGHMLARAQSGDGLRRVQVNGRINMHRVDQRIAD